MGGGAWSNRSISIHETGFRGMCPSKRCKASEDTYLGGTVATGLYHHLDVHGAALQYLQREKKNKFAPFTISPTSLCRFIPFVSFHDSCSHSNRPRDVALGAAEKVEDMSPNRPLLPIPPRHRRPPIPALEADLRGWFPTALLIEAATWSSMSEGIDAAVSLHPLP